MSGKFSGFEENIIRKATKINTRPEDHWSCMAHLRAEDMLKSTVTEEKKIKILNLSDLDQGQ